MLAILGLSACPLASPIPKRDPTLTVGRGDRQSPPGGKDYQNGGDIGAESLTFVAPLTAATKRAAPASNQSMPSSTSIDRA